MIKFTMKIMLIYGCSTIALTHAHAQSKEPLNIIPTSSEEKAEASTFEEDALVTTLQPVTVTADRKKKALMDVPANVTTVTRDELDRRMDNLTEDVFRYEPGIEVPRQSSGADPFSSSGGITIRGVGGNRTQVLVDGNRTVERITDSTRDIVDSSNVKAVEVVRGPASVLWGSDGLGGTVNFVTKDPIDYLGGDKTTGGSANFNYDTLDDSYTESVTGAARLSSKVQALIAVTRRDANEIELSNARSGAGAVQNCTRNPEATPCNKYDPADIESNNILGKLIWNPTSENQFRLSAEYFTRDTQVDQNSVLGDDGTGTIHSYKHLQEMQRWRVSLDQDWAPAYDWLDRVKWQLSYSPQTVDRLGNRLRTVTASTELERRLSDQDYTETFIEADFQLESSFDLGPTTHALTYGFDGDIAFTDYNRLDTTYNLTTDTVSTAAAGGFNFADATTLRADGYLQDEIGFFDGRLKLIPGARLAHYSIDPKTDSDYQLVPGAEPKKISKTDLQMKLGAIFELTNTYSLYGQYSQGFKMPTAQQLFQSLDSLPSFALVPNPNLKPETVDSFELGFRGNYGKQGYFSVNGFYAKYKNFIQNFVTADPLDYGLPAGSFVLTYDNADEMEIYGIEASAGFQISQDFSTRIALSYQDATITNDGVEDVYNGALPFQAVTGLRYNNKDHGVDVELIGTFQAGAPDVADSSSEYKPAGFAVFDLVSSWEAVPNLTLRAGLYNIFDTRYFAAETRGFTINGSDATKATNPIELQTAPGRSLKVGVSYTF